MSIHQSWMPALRLHMSGISHKRFFPALIWHVSDHCSFGVFHRWSVYGILTLLLHLRTMIMRWAFSQKYSINSWDATLGTDIFLSFYLHKAAGESLGHRRWRDGLRICFVCNFICLCHSKIRLWQSECIQTVA
jgi:hypothetical protein